MKKDIFEIYDNARQNLVDSNCHFISVKSSSALGQGSGYCKALDKVGKNYRKLEKIREKLLKKYPQLKDLFSANELNIPVEKVKEVTNEN